MICVNGLCVSTFNVILFLVIIFIVYYLYLKLHDEINKKNKFLINKINENEKKLLTEPIKINKVNKEHNNNISIDTEIDIIQNNREKIKGLPINIHTREMDSLKQLGVLYKHDINDDNIKPGNNDRSIVLPLYGRTKYRGSTKWIYYTTSDSHNSIRIPIYHKNKQCDKEIGCNELYSDDIINIPALNGDFKVHINETEELRYIPY